MECDEEDSDVVLKNSELYKYLFNCNCEEFDWYDKNNFVEKGELYETAIRTPITKVPTEHLVYLDAILNSNILLDEDVTYLYGYTVDLISDLKVKKTCDVVFGSLLGICSLAVGVRYSSLIKSEYIFETCLAVKSYFDKWRRTRCLLNLISTVKQVHLYFKKTLQVLYEQNAYFKLQQLKSKTNGKTEEFDVLEKKKKIELDTLSTVLGQCIINNILKTRNAIRYLINELPLIQPVDSKDHYLAFMSDEELGLPAYTSSTSSASSLDTLRNIYLLMQSEFFRRLGLCFCPTLLSSNGPLNILPTTFEVIEMYSQSCEGVLSVIKFYYKRHVFPGTLESHKPKDSTLISGYSFIHKVSTSLSQLVMDSRVLEEYIENLKTADELDANIMCNRLEELRRDFNKCLDNINCAEKYFFKLRRVKDAKMETSDQKEHKEVNDVEDKQIPQGIEVGKMSQNIDSKDRVYFAITEGKIKKEESQEKDDIEPIKFPNFLLTELKEALIEKKNEFRDRENKAVEDQDEYKKFLDTQITELEEPDRNKAELPVNNLSTCDFQMHKMLASAVAQRSAKFLNYKEEQFGSSDESDNDS